MLLKILKTNQAYNLILFPVIGILLWSVSLISPLSYPFFEGESQMVLFAPLFNLLKAKPFIQVFVTLGMVILLGFYIQRFNSKFGFIRKRTLLPSSYFVVFVGGLVSCHTLHPVMFSAVFLMLALNRGFDAFEKKNIHSNAFDTFLLLSIGSLFYLNSLFLFPALILALVTINREYSWREFALSLVGLLLPWLFVFSLSYFMGSFDRLMFVLSENILSKNNHIKGDIPLQVFLAYQALLVIIASLNLLSFYDTKKISSRKYFASFFWLFLFASLILILVPAASSEILVLIAIPTTFLISNYLVYLKSRLWGEIIFAIFVGLTVYIQFAG